jgi:hypothetical protein
MTYKSLESVIVPLWGFQNKAYQLMSDKLSGLHTPHLILDTEQTQTDLNCLFRNEKLETSKEVSWQTEEK